MKRNIAGALAAALCLILAAPRTRAGAAPEPPAYGEAAHDLPLDVYKQLKVLWDASYGLFDFRLPASAALLPAGVRSRDDAKKALGEAAVAHKAELLKSMNASQVIHRELAAKVLESCGDAKAAVTALGQALAADPDESVRVACAGGLGRVKDAAGVEALTRALQDSAEAVRGQAALALGVIGDNRAGAPLLEVLARDEKPAVRRRAANALAEIKDPNTLEGLLKALSAEQDYRVRMAVAGAVRAIRGKDTPATEGVPASGEQEGVLSQLSKDMRGIEEKLRSDRHDQVVQVEQKEVEDKLNKLIEQVEQMMQQQSSSSHQQQNQQQRQQQQQQQQQQSGARRPSSPMPDSKVGGGAEKGALNPAEVASRQAEWAKLPPSMREELMQVYREGMPERWRLRLMAYYKSLAEEEVQPNK